MLEIDVQLASTFISGKNGMFPYGWETCSLSGFYDQEKKNVPLAVSTKGGPSAFFLDRAAGSLVKIPIGNKPDHKSETKNAE